VTAVVMAMALEEVHVEVADSGFDDDDLNKENDKKEDDDKKVKQYEKKEG